MKLNPTLLSIVAAIGLSWSGNDGDWQTYRQRLDSGQDLAALRQQLETMEDDPQLWLLLSELCLKLDDEKAAIDYGRKAVEALPDNPQAKFHLAMGLQRKMSKNPMLWTTGKAEYLGLLKDARTLDPNYVPAYLGAIGFYSGAPAFVGGSKDKAHQLADELILKVPVQGRLAKMDLYAGDKDWESAGKIIQQLTADHPDRADLRFRYGRLLQDKGDYRAADRQFASILEDEAWGSKALYQSARSRILGEFEPGTAIDQLDRYIAGFQPGDEPDQAAAWWRRGMALQQLDRLDEAGASFEKALAINPEMEEARQSLQALKQ